MPSVFRSYSQIKGEMNSMILRYSEGEDSMEARRIGAGVARKFLWHDYHSVAAYLFKFVRDEIIYLSDPVDRDLYQSPKVTLDLGAGDCNNKVLLLASIYSAIGYPVKVVWVFENSPSGKVFESDFPAHVFLKVDVNKTSDVLARPEEAFWIAADTVPNGFNRKYAFGEECKGGYKESFLVDLNGPVFTEN